MRRRASIRALVATITVVMLMMAMALPVSATDPTRLDLTATKLSPTDRVSGFKAPSSSLAQSDPDLLARNDAQPVHVVIKLDYDAVAVYEGGIDGLAATSPRVTGKPLTGKSAAERAYKAYIAGQEKGVLAALAKLPGVKVGQRLQTVYGGVAAQIPARSAEAVLAIDGVAAIQYDALNQPLTDSSPEFIGADAAYAALGSTANAGKGMILANLDTGLWPEHRSFADLGNLPAPPARSDGTARTCDYGDNPLTVAVDPFVCQHKLIGGEDFLLTYDFIQGDEQYPGTARDGEGHGTHTASTSAGNIVHDVTVLGINRGTIHGIAPGAYVIEYRVCGPQGCYSSDSAAAVQEAIYDGADVINFSISGGTSPFADPVELAFLDAYAAGVFVSASAGNEGPGASTANHLSPWVTSVAASTQTREFATTLNLTAGNGNVFTANGASITSGVGPAPVVMAAATPGYSARCLLPATSGTFTNKIVACERGTNARVDKGYNVRQGGAAGMILYNPTLLDVETDNHWLPTVHLPDGRAFVAFMGSHTRVTGSFAAGEARDGQGDVMAAFSSRGPAGNFIKPDVTAPGVQILAGNTPTPGSITDGPPGEYFMAIAGTSMSSPHVAGAALLVGAAHTNWTPGQIKSALMTTAVTDVLKEDLATPADPFDFGAGRINVGASIGAPLTFDESAGDYFAMANDPVLAVNLNLPSIDAPVLPGRLTTTRDVLNVTGKTKTFHVSVDAPAGTTITVSPANFTLNKNKSKTLTITIATNAPMGVQQFGAIRLSTPGWQHLHVPVAFIHTQGSVSLMQDCQPSTIHKGNLSICDVTAQNNSFEDKTVNLDTYTDNKLDVVGAIGATKVNRNRVTKHNLVLAAAQLGIPSLDTFGPLGSGYLSLGPDGFNVPVDPIGDEEILNFDSAPFLFNGKTYTTFGVDSNGYVVVGDATAEDNNCCTIPAGPSADRPNNVLAPFWTDLEGRDGLVGDLGIYAATLSGGGMSWNVIEFRLVDYGTLSERISQVWIGTNGVQDITLNYGNAQAAPAGQDFLVGAENEAGQGQMDEALPTEDFVVNSTDPAPGASYTYTVVVKGVKKGVGIVRTEMTANGVPGVTIVKSEITVQ